MSECENIIEETGKRCGEDVTSPFHTRFCSQECADRTNQQELSELGITPDMMREALEGYYECKEMIEQREQEGLRPMPEAPASHSPYESGPDEPSSS